ncbi:Heterokaryon incompatibility protein 6, OR allele [Colletotrichum fructicola Nara gc5]|uniref:Heterokaryon incompatibility protein 6, OR allele n=1 Tax=Colletotrichum fructicola (strain Nara gc5) TaxID=1213859 RepID=A0A7J6IK98_COLFN|nr:Heterokaryon incompatibility protein 6, OR allele [Colletotrichum fructicola Nara gc5]
MSYQHTQLSGPRRTRLLVLHPAYKAGEVLSGSLIEFGIQISRNSVIEASHHFEALSYVWGPPSSSHYLQLGALILPITANCDAALRHLRRASEDRNLWVDSICIDQTPGGVQERNTQVAMMGDIYQVAEDVLVWLGNGDAKTDAFFLHLKRLYLLRDDSWEDFRTEFCTKFMNQCDTRWGTSDAQTIREIIEDVLGRPWFERMWTLQELLLATHATILCGKQVIAWDTFCQALELMEAIFSLSSKGVRNFVNCFYAYSDFRDISGSTNDQEIQRSQSELAGANEEGKLSSLVQHARIRHATNPKDKIFGLYGISQRLGQSFPSPDYTQSVAKIYTEATKAIIRHENTLWPLDNVWSGNRQSGLPSWVPDWSDDYRWFDDVLIELGGVPLDSADRETTTHWEGPVDGQSYEIKFTGDDGIVLQGQTLGVIETVFDDRDRALIEKDILAAQRLSVEYELTLKRHGAERIRFFRRIYAECDNAEHAEACLLAFCWLLLTYSPNQPKEGFKRGFKDLHTLFKSTLPGCEENRRYIFSQAREKLQKALNEHQRHPKVLAFVDSDIDAAIDVVLSLHQGPEYVIRSTPEDARPGSVFRLLGSATGFYRTIQGLSINKAVFIADSDIIGYAQGRVCVGDSVVKFYQASSPSVLHPCGPHYQLHSPAVVKTEGRMTGKTTRPARRTRVTVTRRRMRIVTKIKIGWQ